MFEKNLRIAYLLDFYGEALDEHTRDIMKSYYDDDLSLAEIAVGENISRQGIRHIIKKGEEQLEFLETRLGLANHHTELTLATEKLKEVIKALTSEDADRFKDEVALLSEVASTIMSKGV